ncbi:MAG: dicarboxylate/amino acid:cation symporter, partial [Acidaminococcaceae bacterium]|nr:dicarboxylate/amino acid:cation symporter [Acidaminococcaceae bacterium]
MNLSVQILVALILSVCAGLVIGPEGLPFVNKWIAPIGTIFINFIKMMIVPVVTCSLIVGVTSLGGDSKKLGRISAKTICLYLITTAIAIVLGFAVAGIIQPGVGLDIAGKVAPKVKEAPTFMQVLVNMVPTNPVDAMAKGQILPVIIFALLVGIGITQLDEKRSRFLMD